MHKNTIYKISDSVIIRFEHKLQVFYLLNFANNKIWTGNFSSGFFISKLNGEKNINDILGEMEAFYEGTSKEELRQAFNEILTDLLNENHIEIVSNKS